METQIKDVETKLIKDIRTRFTNFIQSWQDEGVHKYKRLSEQMINNGRHTLVISLADFLKYDLYLAQTLFNEYYKYEPILNQAVTEFMHEFEKNIIASDQNKTHQDEKDKYDVTFDKGFSPLAQDSVRDLKS